MAQNLLKRGQTFYRFELYQSAAPSDRQFVFAPGGALSIIRGAEHWLVSSRAYFGGNPSEVVGDNRALRLQTGAEVGLAYEFNAQSSWTFYLGCAAGF